MAKLTQLVEDLTVTVVHVNDHDEANLVTRTQGVALCQRTNAAHGATMIPTTFVLRQQWVAHAPVVVHLSIRAYGHVLDQVQVSYFCVG